MSELGSFALGTPFALLVESNLSNSWSLNTFLASGLTGLFEPPVELADPDFPLSSPLPEFMLRQLFDRISQTDPIETNSWVTERSDG